MGEEHLFLDGEAGRLETYWSGEEPASAAALILHPHPLYGGSLHNKVVVACRNALRSHGLATLRLNFRGVGLSEGEYADGIGESRDVALALDFLGEKCPGLPLILAGFSFGAWLALKIGVEDERVRGLLSLGTPVGWGPTDYLQDCRKPRLFVHGDRDEFCDPELLREEYAKLPEPKELHWIGDADHFFSGKEEKLEAQLVNSLGFLLKG